MALLTRFLQSKQSDVKSTDESTQKRQRPGRKSQSLRMFDEESMGGVFVSANTISLQDSTHSDESSAMSSPPSSWKSSGAKDHHKNSPLIVMPPGAEEVKDEALALGMVMARSRQLPSTWYFSSNHVMVNQERARHTIAPLIRMKELDEYAKEQAEAMAAKKTLFHSSPAALHERLNDLPARRLGENVARGISIREIHVNMLMNRSDKNNILDRRYTNMGMATARGDDGELYMVQVFLG